MIINFKRLQDLYTKEGARYAFEILTKELLNSELGIVRSVGVHSGDNGIECYLGNLDSKPTIFQCKYFPEAILDPQKQQIRESFQRISNNKDIDCEKWILCVPKDLSYDENKWFDEWKKKQTISIELYDESYLRGLLNKHVHVRDQYFQNTNVELLKQIIEVLSKINSGLETSLTKRKKPDLELGIIANNDEFFYNEMIIPVFVDYRKVFEENIKENNFISVDAVIKYIQKLGRSIDPKIEIEKLAIKLHESYNKSYEYYSNSMKQYSIKRSNLENENYIVFCVNNKGSVPASNVSVRIYFPENIDVEVIKFDKNQKTEKIEIPDLPNMDSLIKIELEDKIDQGFIYPFNVPVPTINANFDFLNISSKNPVRNKINYDSKKKIASFWLKRVSHGNRYDHHLENLKIKINSNEIVDLKYEIICDEYEEYIEGTFKLIQDSNATKKNPFDQFE